MSAAPSLVNLNGTLLPTSEAQIPALDHGLLYGDGLFETLRVYDGKFFRLEAHLARLEDSAQYLDLSLPWTRDTLAEALRTTVQANSIAVGSLRLTVTRGTGPPIPDPSACDSPNFLITARPWTPPDPTAWERGVSVCVAGRHPQWHIPGLKTLCYLPFQQARVAARRQGCEEGLLEVEGILVEGATSNLFVVRDGELHTPPLESGCLPGITRAVVLELAAQAGIVAEELHLGTEDLRKFGEIFLTNSLQEIMPVTKVAGRLPGQFFSVGDGAPGPITRRLHQEYQALVQRELVP